jgi:hypothetical protein
MPTVRRVTLAYVLRLAASHVLGCHGSTRNFT